MFGKFKMANNTKSFDSQKLVFVNIFETVHKLKRN